MRPLQYLFIILAILCASFSTKPSKGVELLAQADTAMKYEEFAQGLELYTRALDAAQSEGDMVTQIKCTGYIGNIYHNFGDNNRALDYWLKGYNLAVQIKDLHLQKALLNNIVAGYCRMGNATMAKHYQKLDISIADPDKDLEWEYYKRYNNARIAAAEGHLAQAIKLHQATANWAKQHKLDEKYVLFQESEIANLLLQQKKLQQTIDLANTNLATAQRLKLRELIVFNYKLLSDAHLLMGNNDLAQQYSLKFFALNDSVYNLEHFNDANYKLFKYEANENKEHISSLNSTIITQAIVIAITVLLMALTIIAWVKLRRKNKNLREAHLLLIAKHNDMAESEAKHKQLLEQYIALAKEQEEKQEQEQQKQHELETAVPGNEPSAPQDQQAPEQADEQSTTKHNRQSAILEKRISDVFAQWEYISNPAFSLQMLADAVKSNTHYVSKFINQTYGKNFSTLLNEHRVRAAAQRLQESGGRFTIQSIYQEVGYTSAATFIRAFKKTYGMTPSDYQQLIKSSNK